MQSFPQMYYVQSLGCWDFFKRLQLFTASCERVLQGKSSAYHKSIGKAEITIWKHITNKWKLRKLTDTETLLCKSKHDEELYETVSLKNLRDFFIEKKKDAICKLRIIYTSIKITLVPRTWEALVLGLSPVLFSLKTICTNSKHTDVWSSSERTCCFCTS